jgi:predicted AlkP superfamily pyrophosphatase or phosphodiesterase
VPLPREHGCVANGWYFRDLAEIWFWRQSNHLVAGEKIWDGRDAPRPDVHLRQDVLVVQHVQQRHRGPVTPRPLYPADGRKLPDVYSTPIELRDELQAKLGTFPLFSFWGPRPTSPPRAGSPTPRATSTTPRRPTLTLAYLPHLDYVLQRPRSRRPRGSRGPREIDAVCGELIEHFQRDGARVIVLSEYGITEVRGRDPRERVLREAGLLAIKPELGHDMLDAGASEAFAVADHQLAHFYVRRPERVPEVQRLLAGLDGVERVLDAEGKRAAGLDHPRSGESLLVSARGPAGSATTSGSMTPAHPTTHRTSTSIGSLGTTPVELFLDPSLWLPQLRWAGRLPRRRSGFRYLMDVIPLDTTLVRGSHGRSRTIRARAAVHEQRAGLGAGGRSRPPT